MMKGILRNDSLLFRAKPRQFPAGAPGKDLLLGDIPPACSITHSEQKEEMKEAFQVLNVARP